ncbi:MAG: hypothetical protein ACPGVH_00740 [Chitinophagales bacterium]
MDTQQGRVLVREDTNQGIEFLVREDTNQGRYTNQSRILTFFLLTLG